MACSGCKFIYYCSTACQRIGWPVHKVICKAYSQFIPTRPDLNHHSAIYFGPDESEPRFVWLLFEPGHNHPKLEHLEQLGLTAELIEARSWDELPCNPMLARHIERHYILFSLPEADKLCPCCNPDAEPNESLVKVDSELSNHFRGPVLVLGSHCESDTTRKPSNPDLGPVDFRHVVDHLRMFYCRCEDDIRNLMKGKDVKVVRINCKGDMQFLDRPILEAVSEPKSALLLDSEIPTPVADKIGLQLIVRKVPPAVVWRDTRRSCRILNEKTRLLNPPELPSDTGSVVIHRKDGRPLHPLHIRGLLGYTTLILLDLAYSGGCITVDVLVAGRINQVTKKGFQAWYSMMRQESHIMTLFIPSPFDIPDDFKVDGGAHLD